MIRIEAWSCSHAHVCLLLSLLPSSLPPSLPPSLPFPSLLIISSTPPSLLPSFCPPSLPLSLSLSHPPSLPPYPPQNWEHCGPYFWIKHCLELILSVANPDLPLQPSPSSPLLPSISSIGPVQTSMTRDVPEPPAITMHLPEVHVRTCTCIYICIYR